MARVIAVCTQKGGVGKTTTVANLGAAWGSLGRRVLAVDFDPQFALTRRFGIDPSERSTIVDVLEGMILKAKTAPTVAEVIVREATPLVDVVPAHRRLADIETSLVREIKREAFLRRALRGHTDPYDIVLIDCPPNLGLLTVNALCAADEAVVPIDMKSVDALAGAEELIATAEALEEDGPRVTALVRNRVEGRPGHRRQVYTAIDDALGQLDLPVARTLIPARDDFEKAAILQEPLVVWRPDHIGSLAFRSLADELDSVAA
ncbi:MAG: ParA family protein [Solirubrobacteraceae bacterium]